MTGLFDRLRARRPPPAELTRKPLPARELLDWRLGYWPKPTIRARDIHRLGPNTLRDR
jgi:hypothetical protein